MIANTLTRKVGATFVPIVLETLVKHYFDRLRKELSVTKVTKSLRQDELLYDQAFALVKVSDSEIILVILPLSAAFISEFSRSCFTVSHLHI
jgi:ABC-type microcin C transport system permease subunit YejB